MDVSLKIMNYGIFEKELYNYLQTCMIEDNDIIFMKEKDYGVNIGFMLIKNTKKVKELFNNVIEDHKVNPNEIDQDFVNKYLQTWDGKYKTFSSEYVLSTTNHSVLNNKNNICVFQPLCSATNNYKINILEKLFALQYGFNLDLSSYINDLSKDLDDESKTKFINLIELYYTLSNTTSSSVSNLEQ